MSKWSRWVDFRSVEAQGGRLNRGIAARALAVLSSYVHSSAQTHCTLMFHHVRTPPDSAVN
eukprot:2839393-Pyramimonas_sp.AAC.1